MWKKCPFYNVVTQVLNINLNNFVVRSVNVCVPEVKNPFSCSSPPTKKRDMNKKQVLKFY